MEIDDIPSEIEGPSRSSTSSVGNTNPLSRPTSAPVTGFSNSSNTSTRAIRTAPAAPTTSNDQNVRVVARVRPLSTKEINERSGESIVAHSKLDRIVVAEGDVNSGSDTRKFDFDSVFGPSSTQQEVYEHTCGDMISSSIFKGFNATILAYGQTGSGKTFTMGTDGNSPAGSSDDAGDSTSMKPPSPSEGVIARAVYDLFQTKENSVPNGSERVKVTMSYLEIYNEQAIDLLNDDPSSSNATLQVRDSKTEGVIIPNLKHFDVSSPEEVRVLMEKASLKRATASTAMNSVSSRSHAICTLNVAIAPNDEEENANEEGEDLISPRSLISNASSSNHGMRAKLTLVDLAGSERIKKTGAEGARMKEGISINKGLFVLGQVVSALSELGQRSSGGQHAHIPYRDSKLTRLLQDSLGGNSRTVMIACISPAESNIEESINTLRYAERTRNIKNSAVRNVVSSGGLSASEAAALRRENQQLKLELARMESRMIVSSNNNGAITSGGVNGASGFSFGGLVVSTDNHNMELQAQCSSLLAENDLLKSRAKCQTKEVLEASLRADKWQTKSEAIVQLAQLQGVDLSEAMEDVPSSSDGIVGELRSQLAECKVELMEARTETAVARATAGAIIASNGDLGIIEDIVGSENTLNLSLTDDDDNAQNEQLTTELSTVSATIEQKEAMVLQMNKERACMDNLQLHFEKSLRMLQTEVDTLTSERDELVVKMSSNGDKENNKQRRNKRTANDPITKKLRGQISKLEDKIDGLKLKTNEHKKSKKMREDAEKKCAHLTAEIAEDKRRRADLQRKLKETSVEMRAEKKEAQKKAAKMMKDSQKLKIELMKMKSAAQKQAAVLKRKIGQASAKEKARAELERKRRSAEKIRLASSSAGGSSDIKESKKIELSSWVDRELEYSLIRFQIDGQRRQLDSAVSKRRKLTKNAGDDIDAEELGQMDSTVRTLRRTVQDLESTVKKAFPIAATDDGVMTSTFRFLETDTFKGLSKPDAKYVLSYIFDTCTSAKQELNSFVSNQDATAKSSIDSALAKEYQLHEKEITKIKMEHGEAAVKLLESTQEIVNSNIKLKMDNDAEGLQEQVDDILESYNESWTSTAEDLKFDLDDIKDTQEDLQQMMDNIAKGMTIAAPKKTKKKAARQSYDSEAFESEESFMEDDGGNDSEYEPTPAKAKRKQQEQQMKKEEQRLAKKATTVPGSPSSPIGENYINDIDNKRVGSLKKACKKLGMPMTGKKADLKERVREHILNCSMALNNPAEEENDESFSFGSALKKVNFEGDVAVDPEFQAVDESIPTESIKKNLWQETEHDNVVAKVTKKPKFSSTTLPISKLPPKTPSKMTPCKRKKSPPSNNMVGVEKENPSETPSKKTKIKLGFGTSSPRPLSSHNAKTIRTPVHMKQTIAASKKRLVPDVKQSAAVTKRNISASTKKRTKRGMNDAVAKALKGVF